MRRITRYVFGELLAVFLATLAAMTALMIMVGLVIEAFRQGLGPEPVLRLIPYVLPNALRFAIPGAILFAACSVYGRMSSANEVVAVKSLGISPMAVLWPGFALAVIVSLLSVWLNDVAATWGREGMQRVVMQSLEQIVYGTLRTHRSYRTSNGRLSISVRGVDGRFLVQPTMSFQSSDGHRTVTLTSQRAELRGHPEKDALSIIMWNTVVEFGDKTSAYYPDMLEHEIPLRDAIKNSQEGRHPREFATSEIPREIRSQQESIQKDEQTLAAQAACHLLAGDFEALSGAQWAGQYQGLQLQRTRLFRLFAEPWRRWSDGFSCFFFVWVGAPLAIRWRNADVFSTFGVCFLPILAVYYPLLVIAVDRAKAGVFPPYAVWLGNIILLMVGGWFLRRVMRY